MHARAGIHKVVGRNVWTRILTGCAILALSCAAAWGATDSLSISEEAGVTTTNYPVQIGRPFADRQIQNFPQAGICTDATCSAVSNWLTTQADVKQLWPSGYVKHAIISFYLPTLSAGSTVFITFRNQTTCNCGSALSETKANMLANYNFDAQMQLTGGSVTQKASARAVISAWDGVSSSQLGPVYVWTGGSVSTTLILADHSGASDLGFKDQKVTALYGQLGGAATSATVAYAGDIAALAPTVVTVNSEKMCVVSASGATVTFGSSPSCAGTATANGRGWAGTAAVPHLNGATVSTDAQVSNIIASPDPSTTSIRPIFMVTFWPATKQVKIRYVGENDNTNGFVDQVYSMALTAGYNAPATVYSHATFTHAAGSRWTVTKSNQAGQTWTVNTPSGAITFAKEIWLGGVPSPVAINHNLAYLESTYALPNFDTTKIIPEATMAMDWQNYQSGSRDIFSSNAACWGTSPSLAWGNPGASPWIGPLPLWVTRYVYSGDIREQEIARTCTEQGAAFSYHFRETAQGKNITRNQGNGCTYQCGVSGFGRVASTTNRKTWTIVPLDYSYISTADSLKFSGVFRNAASGLNSAGFGTNDNSHEPDLASTLYLLTGDFWYLEETWFLGSYSNAVANGAATSSYAGRGPTGAEGGTGYNASEIRAMAWGLRAFVSAAQVSPDNTPEKSYFETLINDWIGIEEGARCTGADVYSWCGASPFHGNPTWNWGISTRAQVNGSMGYPPLHQWIHGQQVFVQPDYGVNFVPGTGTITTSGASQTITFSDANQCSQLTVNQILAVACTTNVPNASTGFGCGWMPKITQLSCPTAKTDIAVNLGGSQPWLYSPTVAQGDSQFSADYLMYVLGRTAELGYPAANLRDWFASYYAGLLTDPGSNPRLVFSGRYPTIRVSDGHYFSTYTDLATGWVQSWQTLGGGYQPAGYALSGPPTGYAAYALAASSYVTNVTNGPAAWSWMAANVLPDGSFNGNPTWAITPRSVQSNGGTPISPCDLNSDGIVSSLDVQLDISQSLGTMACTNGDINGDHACNVIDIQRVINAALGQACVTTP